MHCATNSQSIVYFVDKWPLFVTVCCLLKTSNNDTKIKKNKTSLFAYVRARTIFTMLQTYADIRAQPNAVFTNSNVVFLRKIKNACKKTHPKIVCATMKFMSVCVCVPCRVNTVWDKSVMFEFLSQFCIILAWRIFFHIYYYYCTHKHAHTAQHRAPS